MPGTSRASTRSWPPCARDERDPRALREGWPEPSRPRRQVVWLGTAARQSQRPDVSGKASRNFPACPVILLQEPVGFGCIRRLHGCGVPPQLLACPKRGVTKHDDFSEAGAVFEVAAGGRTALAGIDPIPVMPLRSR